MTDRIEELTRENERLRCAATKARMFLCGTDPLLTSGGIRNSDLRQEIDAALAGKDGK